MSYGQLALGWLAFLLSNSHHRKSHVQSWSKKLTHSLPILLGNNIRDTEFTDDRLSRFLFLLSRDETWNAIENDLWKAKIDVYELPLQCVRVDGTTTYGFHAINNGEQLLQLGHAKDGRHGLPQLKLMIATEGDTGEMIAADIAPGNRNDDVL